MSRFFTNRTSLRVTDREIELLLQGQPTGSEELEALEPLVATMIDLREVEPPANPEHMATALAALARTGARPQRTRSRRFVAVAATVGLFFAMSGLAFAADGAAPGDLLYPVDRAFEKIGILDGGIDERLEEFETLLARGETERAFEFLEEVIEEAESADAGRARQHLEEAAAEVNESAAAAQEKVDALRDFIEANRGPGVGVDGRDFGQGVASIASGKDHPEPGPPDHAGPKEDSEPGPPEHAGPKEDGEPGPPEHAEPKDDHEPGPPEHAGPKDDHEPGPPDHAGPSDQDQGEQDQGQGNQGQVNQDQGNQGQGNQGQGKQGQGSQGQGNQGQANQDDPDE